MNQETIISIILTIAFILIGVAIKNKNKSKAIAKPVEKNVPENKKVSEQKLNDFEALLRKLEKRKVVESEEFEAKDDTHSVEYENISQVEHHDDVYDTGKDKIKNNFDLKSAIIYNTILERKKH